MLQKNTISVSRHTILCIFTVFLFSLCYLLYFMFNFNDVQATSAVGFNPGNIISDTVMGNYSAMTKADIQNFLTAKNNCSNRDYNYFVKLSNASPQYTWHWENGHFVCLSEERFGDGVTIGSGQTAAEIIYDAAQEYRINPQVIIVLLQKETGLITDPIPNSGDYRKATGFGCPDTAACDSKYYGFKNQVRNAAKLFRDVLDGGYTNYPVRKNGVYIGYHPNKNCGSSQVFIENKATSALYRYTPYQPNSAALSAGYGTGDACSSYGNRNFYMYFTDWFGSTQLSVSGTPITIPNGTYSLTSALSSNLTLGSSTSYNSQLTNHTSNSKSQWKIEQVAGTSYYNLIDISTGKALDIYDARTTNGTNIQTWSYNNSCAQQWKFYQTDDGYLTLESACSPGMVLDVFDAQAKAGANVQLWQTNSSRAQKWQLYTGKTIADGVYNILSKSDQNKAIDIHNSINANGTNIKLWQTNGAWAQNWQFIYESNTDSYRIINPTTGRALDIAGGSTAQGTNVQLWSQNSTCAQRWKALDNGDGSITLLSLCTPSRALDLSGGNTANDTNVEIWSTNNTDAQKWKIAKYVSGTPITIPNGTYSLTSALSSNLTLGSSTSYNSQLTNHTSNSKSQWKIEQVAGTSYYNLIDISTGKALDIYDARTTNGTNIQTWSYNNSCAQQWKFYQTDDGYLTLESACSPGMVLDVFDAQAKAGANVQLWQTNSSRAQKWQLYTGKTIADGVYNILSKSDQNKAIDIHNSINANGTNIKLWQTNGAWAQNWQFIYESNTDSYRIINPTTGRALDIAGGSTAQGTNVQLWSQNSTCAQRWKALDNGDGSITLLSLCTPSRALDLSGGNTANDTNVEIWSTNNTDAQKWKIRRK